MFAWIAENWATLGTGLLAAIGGLWALAKVVAPLTETRFDDKIAGVLGKTHRALKAILGLR